MAARTRTPTKKTTKAKPALASRTRKRPARKAAPEISRRLPIGAEVTPAGVHFRVWAPRRERVEVVFEGDEEYIEMTAEKGGYFSGLAEGIGAGALYKLRLDGGDAFPDPASRFQPDGPHGPSQAIDPSSF